MISRSGPRVTWSPSADRGGGRGKDSACWVGLESRFFSESRNFGFLGVFLDLANLFLFVSVIPTPLHHPLSSESLGGRVFRRRSLMPIMKKHAPETRKM